MVGMTEPPRRSPLYKLIENHIDGTLAEYVAANRSDASWRAMAADLAERSGEKINGETLRLWFTTQDETVVADAPAGAA